MPDVDLLDENPAPGSPASSFAHWLHPTALSGVIDEVPDATAGCHLVLPSIVDGAFIGTGCEVASESVLAIGVLDRISAQLVPGCGELVRRNGGELAPLLGNAIVNRFDKPLVFANGPW